MFMAGLPDTPEVFDRILSRGRAFLPKPFVPRTLLEQSTGSAGTDLSRVSDPPERAPVARLCHNRMRSIS